MPHPLVVHVKKSQYDVYCGRPSAFGNPFEIGKDGNRAAVIKKHIEWLLADRLLIERVKFELRGKRLGCWCAPLACHCDIYAQIANYDYS